MIACAMGHATLRAVGGADSGHNITVTDVVEIGRGIPDSPQIDDPSISRRHARLTLDSSGELTIEDLDSRNGTRVNGRLITEPTWLDNGDVVDLGDTTFEVFDLDTEPAPSAESEDPQSTPVILQDPQATRVVPHDPQSTRVTPPDPSAAPPVPDDPPATPPVAHDRQATRGRSGPGRTAGEARPRTESGTMVRSRSIAAGLAVIPVKALVARVRLRGAIAALAVTAALWLAFYIQLKSGSDPGLSSTQAAVVTPPTSSAPGATSSTSPTRSATSPTPGAPAKRTTTAVTKQS